MINVQMDSSKVMSVETMGEVLNYLRKIGDIAKDTVNVAFTNMKMAVSCQLTIEDLDGDLMDTEVDTLKNIIQTMKEDE